MVNIKYLKNVLAIRFAICNFFVPRLKKIIFLDKLNKILYYHIIITLGVSVNGGTSFIGR